MMIQLATGLVKHTYIDKLPPAVVWATGFVLAFWVSLSLSVRALITLMALDIVSGIIAAIKERRLSSSHSFAGMGGKGLILILVAASHLVSAPLAETTGLDYDFGAFIAAAYCVSEWISITENCAKFNLVPVPVMGVLAKLKHRWAGPERRDKPAEEWKGIEKRKDG